MNDLIKYYLALQPFFEELKDHPSVGDMLIIKAGIEKNSECAFTPQYISKIIWDAAYNIKRIYITHWTKKIVVPNLEDYIIIPRTIDDIDPHRSLYEMVTSSVSWNHSCGDRGQFKFTYGDGKIFESFNLTECCLKALCYQEKITVKEEE